jgi:hypothetical protein
MGATKRDEDVQRADTVRPAGPDQDAYAAQTVVGAASPDLLEAIRKSRNETLDDVDLPKLPQDDDDDDSAISAPRSTAERHPALAPPPPAQEMVSGAVVIGTRGPALADLAEELDFDLPGPAASDDEQPFDLRLKPPAAWEGETSVPVQKAEPACLKPWLTSARSKPWLTSARSKPWLAVAVITYLLAVVAGLVVLVLQHC